jgi:hypothetical protein
MLIKEIVSQWVNDERTLAFVLLSLALRLLLVFRLALRFALVLALATVAVIRIGNFCDRKNQDDQPYPIKTSTAPIPKARARRCASVARREASESTRAALRRRRRRLAGIGNRWRGVVRVPADIGSWHRIERPGQSHHER